MSATAAMNPRTIRLLQGRIVPTLLSMAWPNVLLMLAQAATGLIETWYVSRLGLDALACQSAFNSFQVTAPKSFQLVSPISFVFCAA